MEGTRDIHRSCGERRGQGSEDSKENKGSRHVHRVTIKERMACVPGTDLMRAQAGSHTAKDDPKKASSTHRWVAVSEGKHNTLFLLPERA